MIASFFSHSLTLSLSFSWLKPNLFYRFQANILFFIVFTVFGCIFMTGANHLYYKLDQYWHNYKGDEFFCSFMLSLSFLFSFYLLLSLSPDFKYTSQQDIIYHTIFLWFESFSFFCFKNWIFFYVFWVSHFYLAFEPMNLLVTFWNVSSMLFINTTISFQRLIKILSLVPFFWI